ncbi:hypothetical protein FY145_00635 [Agrobacterium tumefaciens]|uniref:Uncharacterized protein n=1 Tax=Agrobacterium tumefaciens TaxID=358 RepID=A0AAP9E0P9_AGRTU|nr:hypothetical protein [Agrobacterium tumefaciens]NSZ56576.1 hypothetical protein [Agrobacterium tumefaciens]QDY92784.1 hypothetical protein CG010_000640 [Agrobacterium tumefaciens]UXS47813.1 hypothetical protein FY149_10915 [Agrobacterium tumefaciens]UXS69091.1 hypothetical protein FY146_00635 [Agrobacterium tumefaciens]UXS76755.1 hypothetical protein FY145_00635 [Agrobacterium tumefaciens]
MDSQPNQSSQKKKPTFQSFEPEYESVRFVTLQIALQRAREVYQKDGPNQLFSRIATGDITPFGRIVRTYISTDCYEFSKIKHKLFHKDEYYKQREIIASKIAFEKRDREHRLYAVHEGNESVFCFLDMHLATELENSKLGLYPAEKHFKFRTNEGRSNLFFSSISLESQETIKESRYWRHITYKRHKCYDVVFDEAQLERFFPYTQIDPSRARRGRPDTYPQHELEAALDTTFSNPSETPVLKEITKAAENFYSKKEKTPDPKTLERKSRQWLIKRQKEFGHK